jgi:hypothetical protein
MGRENLIDPDMGHRVLKWIFQIICRGADKSLAFPICSTTKRIFLGWVKEVRTTKP